MDPKRKEVELDQGPTLVMSAMGQKQTFALRERLSHAGLGRAGRVRFLMPDQQAAADQAHRLDQDVADDGNFQDAGKDAGGIGKARRRHHGLVLENVGTQGAGETIQAVISGSADIGAGVGVAGVMRAFSKGAPVRILAPMFTGTGDIYWYVKADSKIQSLKDTTAENTIAYSTNGSSSNNVVVAFVSELGAKAKPTATGGPAATLTAVMSGQVDIGWSAPPFGLQEIKDGKIRILARGSDVPSLHGQTVRVLIVNENSLKTKRDAIMRQQPFIVPGLP